MKRKRNITTHFLRLLRKLGMLCKKPQPFKPQIRIQKSVNAEGQEMDHNDLMLAKNKLHGLNHVGKDKKMCQYDFRTHSCRCGMNIEKLKEGENCHLNKSCLKK